MSLVRPSILVLVLFVGSAHTKSSASLIISCRRPFSLRHDAKICYLKLPTSGGERAQTLILRSGTQIGRYGKDETGTSLVRRRRSLISVAVNVSSLDGKWTRFLMKRDRQAEKETSPPSLLRGTIGLLTDVYPAYNIGSIQQSLLKCPGRGKKATARKAHTMYQTVRGLKGLFQKYTLGGCI